METAVKFEMKTLAVKHRRFQEEAEKLKSENPAMTMQAALSLILDNLFMNSEAGPIDTSELEEHNKKLTLQLEELNSAYSDAMKKIDDLTVQLIETSKNTPFCDLSVVPEEAAKYLEGVAQEMLTSNMHDSVAAWILNMLRIIQAAHKGYIPSNGFLVEPKWIVKP